MSFVSTMCRVVVLTLALIAAPAAATADVIDDALLNHTPKLIEKLKERGHNRVGVLAFMVQHGKGESSFNGAAICNSMPKRVENALILKMNPKAPELTILPQASSKLAKVASSAGYRTPEGRKALMQNRLFPAWDALTKVKPDAFIVGKVQSSDDLRQVKVSLAVFDEERFDELLEFDVTTDRYVLAEIGQGFSLTKAAARRGGASGLKGVGSAGLRTVTDDAIFTSVTADLDETVVDASGDKNYVPNSTKDFPVKLTVYFDNKPQTATDDPDSDGSNNFKVPEPRTGQIITLGVENKLNETVGVVLTVNGTSTLYEEEGAPERMSRWVLAPKKEFRIHGFHQKDRKSYVEIETKSDEESKRMLGDLANADEAGLIILYVFRKSSESPQLASTGERFTRSIGQVPRSDRKRERTGDDTFENLRAAIVRRSKLEPVSRQGNVGLKGLAGMGQEREYSLEEQKLGETDLTDTMIVRYWKQK